MDYKFITDSRSSNSTLVNLLRYRAQIQPRQKAYTFLQEVEIEADTITYEQLDRRSRAIAFSAGATAPIATQLQKLGLAGERALLLYPPGLEFILAFLGCLYAGVIAVPAYPPRRNQKLSRLKAIATDAKAKLAMTTSSLLVGLKTRFAQDLDIASLNLLATDDLNTELECQWSQPNFLHTREKYLLQTFSKMLLSSGVEIIIPKILN